MSLIGNQIDVALQRQQDGQTSGIPVGPDTSHVIAERLLAEVDSRIRREIRPLSGFRYYDDFELCFDTLADAERALALFQQFLREFELSANHGKTRICELPQVTEPTIVNQIRDWNFGTPRTQIPKIVQFFDLAFSSKATPELMLLSYAIGRVKQENWVHSQWPMVEALLLQAARAEPSAIEPMVGAFIYARKRGIRINTRALAGFVNEIIRRHAVLGHHSEVCWALYAALCFRLRIERDACGILSKTDNPFVALMALDAHAQGIAPDVSTAAWDTTVSNDTLKQPEWLLGYEAVRRGWLSDSGFISGSPAFQRLRSLRVSFYDSVGAVTQQNAGERILRMRFRTHDSYGSNWPRWDGEDLVDVDEDD